MGKKEKEIQNLSEKLWQIHKGFIKLRANYYSGQYAVGRDDLEQQGYFGILEATKKFDKSRGVKFLTYAAWWINQKMLEYCYRMSYPFKMVPKLNQIWLRYKQLCNEDPYVLSRPVGEVAELIGSRPGELQNAIDTFSPLEEFEDVENIPTEPQELEDDTLTILEKILPIKQQFIIMLYCMHGVPMNTIAMFFGESRQYIHILKNKALKSLRSYFKQHNIL